MSNKNVAASAKPRMNPGVLGRVIKMLIRFYPVLIPVTAVCIGRNKMKILIGLYELAKISYNKIS